MEFTDSFGGLMRLLWVNGWWTELKTLDWRHTNIILTEVNVVYPFLSSNYFFILSPSSKELNSWPLAICWPHLRVCFLFHLFAELHQLRRQAVNLLLPWRKNLKMPYKNRLTRPILRTLKKQRTLLSKQHHRQPNHRRVPSLVQHQRGLEAVAVAVGAAGDGV